MIGKLKRYLGIEGVKISITLDDPILKSEKAVFGHIILHSLSDQVIEAIDLKFIERYHRGRNENKLIDEYELGAMVLADVIAIAKNQEIKVPFTLAYNPVLSEIDKFGEENVFSKGIAFLAKSLKGVKSEFRIIAKAKVKGTSLDPIVKKMVILE